MNRINKKWDNQALGLLPLCLFMFLENFISYFQSYIISVLFCVVSIIIFYQLRKDKIYLFMLLPASATFILYSILMFFFPVKELLITYTPLVTEIFFVIVLLLVNFSKRPVIYRIHKNKDLSYERNQYIAMLEEFYFIANIVLYSFAIHLLFAGIYYLFVPDGVKDVLVSHFIYRDLTLIIAALIIGYEFIRLKWLKEALKKEKWLPVLGENGKVIGCVAYSVSKLLHKKYFHPIVRVVLIHKGKLFLTNRVRSSFVSAMKLDYPFYRYVLFRETIDIAVHNTISKQKYSWNDIKPRLLIRYVYEDTRVKHQVSLYVLKVEDEKLLNQLSKHGGKLWSTAQIEENLDKGIFSVYFEREYPYLKNTILLAENFDSLEYCTKRI